MSPYRTPGDSLSRFSDKVSEDVSSKMSLIITDDADKHPSLAENVEIRMGIKPEVQEYIRLIPTHRIMTVEEWKW